MDKLTRQLAAHAASLRYDQIPAGIMGRARQNLIDSVGCALGGLHCEGARIARLLTAGAVPSYRAGSVLCCRDGAPMEEAAFINTAMIRYLDFNDAWHAGQPERHAGRPVGCRDDAGDRWQAAADGHGGRLRNRDATHSADAVA